jgi:hypothetical protein
MLSTIISLNLGFRQTRAALDTGFAYLAMGTNQRVLGICLILGFKSKIK